MLAGRAADAVNLFALDVYEHLQREQGNLFFSPLSIATGLAMTYAGAGGQTATEMEQVLHLGTAPGIHDSFNALLSSLDDHAWPLGPEIVVANAIWPQIGFPVNSGFLDVIETDYEGHVQSLDYSNPSAAEDVINDWVEQHTLGKIKDLVSNLTPLTRMVLTNSIYFKGFWDVPFDPRNTAPGTFTRSDGTSVVTPMMVTQFNGPVHTTIDGYDIVDMPFDGGALNADLSMVLIVPPESGPARLPSELFTHVEDWLLNPGPSDYLELRLPKFKTETSTHLNALLAGLGMPTAFGDGADFSAMTPAGVWIDTVFHKAVVEVNEQGTEAAAATQVSLVICFAKGTPVLTPDGEKAIDQLQPGDFVIARDENNLEGAPQPKLVEKVHHNQAPILELHVGGQVVRTTESHPFFVRMRGWTLAGDLKRNDMLFTFAGDWLAVDQVVVTDESEPVYNLRVADYHTYFVGRKAWGFALWAHNACIPEVVVDRPFHFLIRDNTTSTLLFMGRIDDPTQLQNDVTPTVVQPTADFDDNTMVDGADFLAWQRGFGMTTGAVQSDGDSDEDGNVDRDDLAQWSATFGVVESNISANLTAVERDAAPAGDFAALSDNDLFNAAIALERSWSESGVARDSSPSFNRTERFAFPAAATRRATERMLVTDARSSALAPTKIGPRGATDDRGDWSELVDELLEGAFE